MEDNKVIAHNKRSRGDVPSLEDDDAPRPTPEEIATQRHEELIALISGNNTAISNVGEAVKNLSSKVEKLDLTLIHLGGGGGIFAPPCWTNSNCARRAQFEIFKLCSF